MADTQETKIVISAQDLATAVFTKVQGGVESLHSAVGILKGGLAALGVTAAAVKFTGMVESGIEAQAQLHKLSITTGVAVETLSGLKPIAKQAGVGLDEVAGFTQKLEKNMLAFGQGGASKASHAFADIGLTQAQVKAGMQDMDNFLPMFAQKLMSTGNGAQQVALAQELMGKSGAQALPFLRALAEAGQLNGKVTEEQAAAAHQATVNMAKWEAQSNQLKNQLANELVPSINNVLTAMLNARKGGDSFFGALYEGAKKAFQEITGLTTEGGLKRVNESLKIAEEDLADLMKTRGGGPRNAGSQKIVERQQDYITDLRLKKQELETLMKYDQAPTPPKLPKGTGELGDRSKDEKVKNLRAEQQWMAKVLEEGAAEEAKIQAEASNLTAQYRQRGVDEEVEMERQKWKALWENYDADEARQIESTKVYLENLAIKQKADDEALKIRNKVLEETYRLKAAEDKSNESLGNKIGLSIESSMGRAIEAVKQYKSVWEGVRSVLLAAALDVAKLVYADVVTKPAAAGLSGLVKGFDITKLFGGGGATSHTDTIAGALASGDVMGPYASGTDYVPRSGLAWIDQGEQITPAGQNKRGGGINIGVINMPGASVETVARLEAGLRQLQASVPQIAINAVADRARRT